MLCSDDEYMLDGQEVYSLDYRPIEGDVSLPQNAFRAASFMPQGRTMFTCHYTKSCMCRHIGASFKGHLLQASNLGSLRARPVGLDF